MAGKRKRMSVLWPDEEPEPYAKTWNFILMVQNRYHRFFSKEATASTLYLRKQSGSGDESRVTES